MADDTSQSDIRSLRTVFVGTSAILWILAVFIIMTLNSMKKTLESLQTTTQMQGMTIGQMSPGLYEIQDADGNLIYKITKIEEMDEMMGMEGDVDAPADPVTPEDAAPTEESTPDE